MSNDDVRYQVVAARRAQWDNLLWQVPILSLTAQAFLFTISLGPDTTKGARIVSALLSVLMSFLSITLMARHRQAELTDAHWLEEFETRYFQGQETVHGADWQVRRDQIDMGQGFFGRIPLLPGYKTWIVGMLLFLVAASFVLVVTIAKVEILAR
jgi:hypothetical protein